ncbi:collagen alpha-1(I) chain-like [Neofelis nebulosa]|uniref:collagen alpha-1(I) chain-like n=1 Tax=Neofelis nebulosa TaxID=61452 RepID=UPI00272AED8A|nr:collagen alpha-1(I) chain-like [Neofelis nebulosa]XP_058585367.1 collagen alpha-1(I) chain-like [Neofelis nebulosa]
MKEPRTPEAEGQRPDVISSTMGETLAPGADGGCALEIRRAAGERGRRGATPTRSRQGSPAPSRGQRRRGSHGLQAEQGPPGPAGEAVLTCPWARTVTAAPPGKGWGARVGRRHPDGRRARSGGRGARTADWLPGSRRLARPDAAAPGARSGSLSHAGGPAARWLTRRQREPAPERSRSPSGSRRRRRRGGATGSVTRSPGSSCGGGGGGARCGTGGFAAWRTAAGCAGCREQRPRRDRRELLAPRRREGGRVRPPVGGGPGGLEVASRGPRRTGDREGELRRSPARGCTCPDRP